MAFQPLLTTKLQPPLLAKLIIRPHLNDKLSGGLDKQLTVVGAPAGYGKSSAVAAWIGQQARPYGWLSLDEDDNDPARFLSYLIAALQGMSMAGADQIGRQTEAILQTPQQIIAETHIVPLINDIAKVEVPFLIVLDDYHLIQKPIIHQFINLMLQQALTAMRLIIITREEPPLPLARFRGHGDLCEVSTADLQFSLKESEIFLVQSLGLALDKETIVNLHERTNGWVVALQLAGKSLLERPNLEPNLTQAITAISGQNRSLFDYLVSDGLKQFSLEQREFFIITSILDKLNGSLCRAVFGADHHQSDNHVQLERLARSQFILIPLDDSWQWFRYQPLFKEFFQTQLKQQISDQEIRLLHGRAARWFEARELWSAGVRHYLAAEDFEKAAELIERVSLDAWLQGDFSALRYWFGELPDNLIASRTLLSLYHAWVLAFDGQFEDSQLWLDRAAKSIELTLESRQHESHALYTVFSVMLGFKHQPDPERTVSRVEQALRHIPIIQQHWRALGYTALSYAHRENGRLGAANKALFDAETETQLLNADYLAMLITYNRVQFELEQGHFDTAKRQCEQILDSASDSPLDLFLSDVFHNYLGEIYLEWNQLQTAEYHFKLGYQVGERLGRNTTKINALVGLLWLNRLKGNKERMLAIFDELGLIRQSGPNIRQHPGRDAYRAFAALERGDKTAVEYWLKSVRLPRKEAPQPFLYIQRTEYVIWSLIQLSRGIEGAEKAVPVIEQLISRYRKSNKYRLIVELLALLATAQFLRGDFKLAMETLQKALGLAETGRYKTTFMMVGRPMRSLLQEARNKGVFTSYIDTLLSGYQENDLFSALPSHSQPLLSDRERELLSLVAAGLFNRQIAEQLHISINTVKAHLKKIYGKLDVGTRTAAVSRARELGII